MKLQEICVAIILVGAGLQIGCPVASAQTNNDGRQGPRIQFVSPQPNQHISDYPIAIETNVSGFTLEAPVQYWDRVDGPDRLTGHIHYTLDDCPIFATSKTKWVMLKPMGKSLPPGKHILRAELVNPNHENLNPESFAEVEFICDGAAKNGGGNGQVDVPIDERGRDQLKKLENQLQEVQEEVGQLKLRLKDVQ